MERAKGREENRLKGGGKQIQRGRRMGSKGGDEFKGRGRIGKRVRGGVWVKGGGKGWEGKGNGSKKRSGN